MPTPPVAKQQLSQHPCDLGIWEAAALVAAGHLKETPKKKPLQEQQSSQQGRFGGEPFPRTQLAGAGRWVEGGASWILPPVHIWTGVRVKGAD